MIGALPPGASNRRLREYKLTRRLKRVKRAFGSSRRAKDQALMYQGTLMRTIRWLPCSKISAFSSSAR